MQKNKGITLIALVTMVIIVLILASVGTTTGLSVIRQSKYNRAVGEMKIMQTKINEMYDEYKSGELNVDNLGTSINNIPSSIQSMANTAYNSVYETNQKIGNIDDFKYLSADDIKNTLDVDGVEEDYIINIKTREVILINGTKNDGEMYYSLSQIETEQFNIEYVNPSVNYSPDGGRYILPKNITNANNLNMTIELSLQDIPNNMTEDDLIISYAWSISKENEPTGNAWTTLENSTTIIENGNSNITQAGDYYLWTKVTDKSGKTLNTIVSKKYTVKKEYDVNVKVAFDATGGEVDKTDKIVINKEQYGDLPTPTKAGYVFEGWYTDLEGNGTKVEPNNNLELPEENLPPKEPQTQTLYAKWEETSLMATSKTTETEAFLGTSITRDKIKKVSFLNTLDGHTANNIDCWDVSDKQNHGVLLWIHEDKTDANGNVEVVIGQDGGVYANPSSGYLFSYIGNTIDAEIELENLNTSRTTNMNYMFYKCIKVLDIDVSKFNTSKVTCMEHMFGGCKTVKILDVSRFDTSNVTTMYNMFWQCDNLEILDVSKFNTSKVENMRSMFDGCHSVEVLDVSNFDTSNVTTMRYMFLNCEKLTSIDVSNFDTSNVTTMYDMFCNCTIVTTIDVSGFDTSKVTDMYGMFSGCKNLVAIDVSNFDTSKVTDMQYMFNKCNNLITLNLSGFDTSKVVNMSYMFGECINLTNIDLSNFDTSKVTSMKAMFYKCNNLSNIGINGVDTSQVNDMQYMFNECKNLIALDLKEFNTNNVTNMQYMFAGCNNLTTLDVSAFNTSKVTTMLYMFRDCSNLTTIDVSNFNTSNVTNMRSMFHGCNNLSTINVSGFNTSNVTNMMSMFNDCNNITTLDVSGFDTSKVTNMQHMFNGCNNITTLDVSGFDTNQVTNMQYMFAGCKNVTMLDVGRFNTSKVIYMYNMFNECDKLTTLDLSSFDTSNVTDMKNMFYGDNLLKTIYISEKWNTEKITDIRQQMFYNCTQLVGGAGTTYNSSNKDNDLVYAHIDEGETNPGYLTYKQAPVTTSTNSSTTTSSISGNSSNSLSGLEAVAKSNKKTLLIAGIIIVMLSGIVIWRIKKQKQKQK